MAQGCDHHVIPYPGPELFFGAMNLCRYCMLPGSSPHWASRPYGDNVWNAKPVAIAGASIGILGTARAQYHLRQSFVFLNMYPLNQSEVMIANAASKFDERGNFRDEKAKELIRQLLTGLVEWTRLLRALR